MLTSRLRVTHCHGCIAHDCVGLVAARVTCLLYGSVQFTRILVQILQRGWSPFVLLLRPTAFRSSPMRSMTTPRSCTLVALLAFCLLPSIGGAQVPQFDSLYVFGDSIADTGNIFMQTKAMRMNPPVPPSVTPHQTYFDGNFSNGYMAFEFLWERLSGHRPGSPRGLKPFLEAPILQKTGAINFAFGGTGTPYVDQTPGGFYSPGLKGQVELFQLSLKGKQPSPRSLYVVSTGANDYRGDPFNVPMHPEDVVNNIEQAIVRLYGVGARHVMVLDLPDLGQVPANGGSPDATALSTYHNMLLDGAVARLRAQYPSLRLTLLELDPLFTRLRDTYMMDAEHPLLDAYVPTKPWLSTCLVNPASCEDVPRILFNSSFGFVFWDNVHPTTEAHHFLGDYAYEQLVSAYQ
jgi:phospholipase/lecithinase/hemolysin